MTLLSILATVGTVNAESGILKVDVGPDKSEIIRGLVNIGAIKPLQEENWYEINHELLNELKQSRSSEVQNAQKRIVDMLQQLVGPNTDVSRVLNFCRAVFVIISSSFSESALSSSAV